MKDPKRKTPLDLEVITPEMCTPEERLHILGQVPFFSGLAQAEVVKIDRLFRTQGFQEGEPIYFEGDPATHFYVVAAGKVQLMRHTQAGKDVLLDLLKAGEYFGGLSPLPEESYSETAIAHTPVCALQIGKDVFRSLLRDHPEVALLVLEITAARLTAAQEMIRQLSAHSVEQRIAFTLLRLADKFGKRHEKGLLIDLPLSRDELAEMTGTTTESASRVASQFQKAGLIETGRRWMAVTDREGLESILETVK